MTMNAYAMRNTLEKIAQVCSIELFIINILIKANRNHGDYMVFINTTECSFSATPITYTVSIIVVNAVVSSRSRMFQSSLDILILNLSDRNWSLSILFERG